MEKIGIAELQKVMSTMPPGDVADPAGIDEMLASCWEGLNRHDGGMAGYKLIGRMEEVKWNPPILRFVIERHGGTVMGSGYAKLQSWAVDLEKELATLVDDYGRRWLGGSRNTPLKVGPIAAEIAELIKTGKQDPRLKWKSTDEARISISKVIPDNCPNQTLVGRRRRFKKALQESLREHGWELFPGANTVKRVCQPTAKSRRENVNEGIQAEASLEFA
jgi:hypothetical protein